MCVCANVRAVLEASAELTGEARIHVCGSLHSLSLDWR